MKQTGKTELRNLGCSRDDDSFQPVLGICCARFFEVQRNFLQQGVIHTRMLTQSQRRHGGTILQQSDNIGAFERHSQELDIAQGSADIACADDGGDVFHDIGIGPAMQGQLLQRRKTHEHVYELGLRGRGDATGADGVDLADVDAGDAGKEVEGDTTPLCADFKGG